MGPPARLSRASLGAIIAGAAALWLAAAATTLAFGPAPGPWLDAWAAAWERAGAALHAAGGLLARDALRGPLAAGLLALAAWRPAWRAGARALALALGLALLAQAWLATGPLALGLGAYAAAVLLAARRGAPAPAGAAAGPPRSREVAGLLAVMALFTLSCLSRLDLYPDLDFDELSYAIAARMQLGELAPGWVMAAHPFARFQAQPLPLWLQAAGVAAAGPGILPLRLVSGLLGSATLLTAYLALRRPLGVAAALAMAALCAVTPLFLASARAGHYLAFTLFHASLCLALLLRLLARRDWTSALGLGVLLGGALYAYQLSWFVPLLAAAAYALCAPATRAGGRVLLARGAAVAAAAVLLWVPAALFMQGGLLAVLAQTLDKAVWSEGGPGAPELWHQPVLLVRAGSPDAARALVDVGRRRGLRVHRLPGEARLRPPAALVHLSGRAPELADAAREIRARGLPVALDRSAPASPGGQAAAMLGQLFRTPSLEFAVRVVEVPLLGALLAPLLVLGVAEAWRRRREPAPGVLLVFGLGGALLPAALGGTVARRAALMLPAVCALAALPLAALLREAAPLGRAARHAARAAVALLLLAAVADGLHGYFRHWHRDVRPFAVAGGAAAPPGGLLELAELLRAQPEDRPLLLPRLFRYFKPYWSFVEEQPDPTAFSRDAAGAGGVFERAEAGSAERVRALSCARTPPFTWVATPAQAPRFRPLAAEHRLRERAAGAYRLWEVEARRPGGCAGERAAAPG